MTSLVKFTHLSSYDCFGRRFLKSTNLVTHTVLHILIYNYTQLRHNYSPKCRIDDRPAYQSVTTSFNVSVGTTMVFESLTSHVGINVRERSSYVLITNVKQKKGLNLLVVV
jgi:hypothetical protein